MSLTEGGKEGAYKRYMKTWGKRRPEVNEGLLGIFRDKIRKRVSISGNFLRTPKLIDE